MFNKLRQRRLSLPVLVDFVANEPIFKSIKSHDIIETEDSVNYRSVQLINSMKYSFDSDFN